MTKQLWVLSLLFFSFASQSGFGAEQKIKIGLVSNFSEIDQKAVAPSGDEIRKGAQLALKKNEARLKAKQIQIQLEEFDYGSSRVRIADAAKKASDAGAVAVIGYNWSSHALLAAPVHKKNGFAMITPTATAHEIAQMGSYVHMAAMDNEFIGQTLAKIAFERLKGKNAAIVALEDCAYCHNLADAFEKEFKRLGGVITVRSGVSEAQRNFKKVAEDIKASPVDVVVVPNYETPSIRIISALAEFGVVKPYLGGDGWGPVSDEFFRNLNGKFLQIFSVTHWHPEIQAATSQAFRKDYLQAFKKEPNDTAVLSYDSMAILIEAILSTADWSRKGVERALSSLKSFEGVTGPFLFRPGKAPQKNIVLLTGEKDRFRVLEVLSAK